MATAPPADQHELLNLQSIDSKLLSVGHRERTLAEHTALEDNAEKRTQAESRLAEAEAIAKRARQELRESEMAVEQVQNKIDKTQSRLDSGSGTSKDLTAMQTEIGHLTDRRGELETDELEKMETSESADDGEARARAEIDDLVAQEAELTSERDAALAKLGEERDALTTTRQETAVGIDSGLLELYDKLRESLEGVAAAAIRHGACDACGQVFSPAEKERFARAEEDFILRCPECERILVQP